MVILVTHCWKVWSDLISTRRQPYLTRRSRVWYGWLRNLLQIYHLLFHGKKSNTSHCWLTSYIDYGAWCQIQTFIIWKQCELLHVGHLLTNQHPKITAGDKKSYPSCLKYNKTNEKTNQEAPHICCGTIRHYTNPA